MTRSSYGRIAALDLARGLAFGGMVLFHATWDLHAFGLIRSDPGLSMGWWLFGRTIAAAFLSLSGLGLVLARRRGDGAGAMLRRMGVIAVAAGGVTVATGVAVPDRIVWFGILHSIVVCGALALPLLDRRGWIAPTVAAISLVLPWTAAGTLPDGLWWTGLAAHTPDTLDYQPLFPSLGFVLLGVAFGENGGVGLAERLKIGGTCPERILCAVGRRSLLLYLLHQPVLFAAISGLAMVLPSLPADSLGEQFTPRCLAACTSNGTGKAVCDAACHCVESRLRSDGSQPASREQLASAARLCTPEAMRSSNP